MALNPQDESRLLQALATDPQLQALIAQRTAAKGGSDKFQYDELIQQRALALGVPKDYRLEGLTTGKPLALDHQNVFQKYGDDAVRYAAGTISAAGAKEAFNQMTSAGAPAADTSASPSGASAGSTNAWKINLIRYGIPAAISTGAAIYQSKQANDAIDKAQQAQQAGTDAARAEQQRVTGVASDIYQQQRADLAPYREGGAQAYSTLGGLMGFAPTAGTGTAGSTASAAPAPAAPTDVMARPPLVSLDAGQPRGGTLADIQQGAITQRQSSYGPQARVRAPNGQVYLVPRERVQEAVANGGQEVG